MAANFVTDLDPETWQAVLACYVNVLQKKADKKTKKTARDELVQLDKWYQETLPTVISEREQKHITQPELVKLMQWKLSRGKFRPRLVEFAASNSADEVVKSSKEAFASVDSGRDKMKNIKKAIDRLSKLKGIGPATASAVLAAGCPEEVGFMADEPTYMVLKTFSLKYNVQEYMAYVEGLREMARALSGSDDAFGWTPHKVELALWTQHTGTALGVLNMDSLASTVAKSSKVSEKSTKVGEKSTKVEESGTNGTAEHHMSDLGTGDGGDMVMSEELDAAVTPPESTTSTADQVPSNVVTAEHETIPDETMSDKTMPDKGNSSDDAEDIPKTAPDKKDSAKRAKATKKGNKKKTPVEEESSDKVSRNKKKGTSTESKESSGSTSNRKRKTSQDEITNGTATHSTKGKAARKKKT